MNCSMVTESSSTEHRRYYSNESEHFRSGCSDESPRRRAAKSGGMSTNEVEFSQNVVRLRTARPTHGLASHSTAAYPLHGRTSRSKTSRPTRRPRDQSAMFGGNNVDIDTMHTTCVTLDVIATLTSNVRTYGKYRASMCITLAQFVLYAALLWVCD